MAKNQALAKAASDEELAELNDVYQSEEFTSGPKVPRIEFTAKDVVEVSGVGKTKKIKVITAAGEFIKSVQSETETDEAGKKIWEKEELGDQIEGIVLYKRMQLRMFVQDGKEGHYISSAPYDSKNEKVALFENKKKIATGTPEELQEEYTYEAENDKKQKYQKCDLKEEKILFILNAADGEVYQLTVRGSSVWALSAYEKALDPLKPTNVLTRFNSEPMVKGDNNWNQMTFENVRKVTSAEASKIKELQTNIVTALAQYKSSRNSSDDESEEEEETQAEKVDRKNKKTF